MKEFIDNIHEYFRTEDQQIKYAQFSANRSNKITYVFRNRGGHFMGNHRFVTSKNWTFVTAIHPESKNG